jgi:hypothetical protein
MDPDRTMDALIVRSCTLLLLLVTLTCTTPLDLSISTDVHYHARPTPARAPTLRTPQPTTTTNAETSARETPKRQTRLPTYPPTNDNHTMMYGDETKSQNIPLLCRIPTIPFPGPRVSPRRAPTPERENHDYTAHDRPQLPQSAARPAIATTPPPMDNFLIPWELSPLAHPPDIPRPNARAYPRPTLTPGSAARGRTARNPQKLQQPAARLPPLPFPTQQATCTYAFPFLRSQIPPCALPFQQASAPTSHKTPGPDFLGCGAAETLKDGSIGIG